MVLQTNFNVLLLPLAAATLCFLLGVLALSGHASCHSAMCRSLGDSGDSGSYSRAFRISLEKTPFVLRRAGGEPGTSESESGTSRASVTPFQSTDEISSASALSVTRISSSSTRSTRETQSALSTSSLPISSSRRVSSSTFIPSNESSTSFSSSDSPREEGPTSSSSSSSDQPPTPQAVSQTSSTLPSQRLTLSLTSPLFNSDAFNSFSAAAIPRTTYIAMPGSSDSDPSAAAAKKLQDILPFLVVLIIMVIIGVFTGARCALRRHKCKYRRGQYISPVEAEKSAPYGWVDRHSTSRRMWHILASKKGIPPREKKFVQPGHGHGPERRRAISEGGISASDPFSDPSSFAATGTGQGPGMNYVDVGFGSFGMMTDEPEPVSVQDGGARPVSASYPVEHGKLPRSKSSPDVRKKMERQSSGAPLVYSPSRPSPLRQSYKTP